MNKSVSEAGWSICHMCEPTFVVKSSFKSPDQPEPFNNCAPSILFLDFTLPLTYFNLRMVHGRGGDGEGRPSNKSFTRESPKRLSAILFPPFSDLEQVQCHSAVRSLHSGESVACP